MVSHTDYSAELSDAYPDRGHPVADPQPGFVPRTKIFLPRVELGDVGYIQYVQFIFQGMLFLRAQQPVRHNHGRFVRLFNVHKQPGSDGQPDINQLPFGFEALGRDTIQEQEGEVDKNLFKSRSVTQLSVDAGGSGCVFLYIHFLTLSRLT